MAAGLSSEHERYLSERARRECTSARRERATRCASCVMLDVYAHGLPREVATDVYMVRLYGLPVVGSVGASAAPSWLWSTWKLGAGQRTPAYSCIHSRA